MDTFALSLINDYLYCPRRAGIKIIEGIRDKNEHTLLGNQAHEHVDFPGYEQRAGWTLLRALPLYSDVLGISGKADLVEIRRTSNAGAITGIRPVEYKKGPMRPFDNDEAQLCAQAFCLEEMFGLRIESGSIYHASSQKRRDVCFDEPLRIKTRETITALRSLIEAGKIPPAELRPQCEGCSLHETCLPEAASLPSNNRALYEPRHYA